MRTFRAILAASTAFAAVSGANAYGQTSSEPASQSAESDVIVVTGSRRDGRTVAQSRSRSTCSTPKTSPWPRASRTSR